MLRTSVPGAIYESVLTLLLRLTPILLPLSIASLPTSGTGAILAYERLGTLILTFTAWMGATFILRKFTEMTVNSKTDPTKRRLGTIWLLCFVLLSVISLAFLWSFRSRSTELMLTLLLIALGAHALAGSDKLKSVKGVLRLIEGSLICIVTWWSIGATLDWQHAAISIVAALLLASPELVEAPLIKNRFKIVMISLPSIIIGVLSLLSALPTTYLMVYGALPFCRRSSDARSISVLTLLLCFIASVLAA